MTCFKESKNVAVEKKFSIRINFYTKLYNILLEKTLRVFSVFSEKKRPYKYCL